jgi:hypothetical protein
MGNPFILDLGFEGISTMAVMKVMEKKNKNSTVYTNLFYFFFVNVYGFIL